LMKHNEGKHENKFFCDNEKKRGRFSEEKRLISYISCQTLSSAQQFCSALQVFCTGDACTFSMLHSCLCLCRAFASAGNLRAGNRATAAPSP